MSFILDALRKSEKTRRQNEVPDLQSVHWETPVAPPKRSIWPLVLVLVLTINAAALLWIFKPWVKPSAAPAQPVALKTEVAAPVSWTSGTARTVAVAPVAVPVTSEPAADQTVTVVAAAPAVASVTDVPLPAPVPEPAPLVTQPQKPRVYLVQDLPPSVKSRIPSMHFSLHYFTPDPDARMVRINDRILREGALFDGGLLLEKITANGVVFSAEGYRFSVSK